MSWKRFHNSNIWRKTMKKFLSVLSLGTVVGVLSLGSAIACMQGVKEVSADVPDYQTYVPVRDGWIENTDGSAESSLVSLIRGRNDRFWSGNPDDTHWDSQERTFNAMDEFVDTIHRANGGEGWRGAYRTPELELHDDNHRYISFLFGGGGDDIFVNVWHVRHADGSETFPEGYNRNVIEGVRTRLDESGYFNQAGVVNPNYLNAPISCNMVFYYFQLPSSIEAGDKYLIYVRDGRTEHYGGFTFGDVHINQTLEDCAKSFSAHKAQMELNEFTSAWNRGASEHVLTYYRTNEYYAAVREAEALLKDANDDFEVNNRLSKWAYDQEYSRYDNENHGLCGLNYDSIYATADHKMGTYFENNDGYMPLS